MATIRADDGVYLSYRVVGDGPTTCSSGPAAPPSVLGTEPADWHVLSCSDPEPGALRDAGASRERRAPNQRVGRLDAFGVTGDC